MKQQGDIPAGEGENMLCQLDKCPHYSKATKYERACYYEPQCWRGMADEMLAIVKLTVPQPRPIKISEALQPVEMKEITTTE
jgi:hypothetical protein